MGITDDRNTISRKQVANLAGVSETTVQRVFANHPHVRTAMRNKVKQAAEQLNYTPNLSARQLRLRKYENIALILCSDYSSFEMPVERLSGICNTLREVGYGLNVVNLPFDLLTDSSYMTDFKTRLGADGLLMNYIYDAPDALIQWVQSIKEPTVWMNVDRPTDTVNLDNRAATSELVEHLYKLGHRKIWSVHMILPTHYSIRASIESYKGAMERHGLEPVIISKNENIVRERRPEFFRDLLGKDRPTAIIAYTPSTAYPLIRAATDLGIKVPDNLSVVCSADASDWDLGGWRLTHMRAPDVEVGKMACEMLMRKIADPGKALPSISVRYKFMPGETTSELKRRNAQQQL